MAFGALGSLFTRVKAIAGLRHARHIQPHSFRHGCATRLMLNGANLLDIKDHLGHANIETTAKYLHSDELSQRRLAEFGALRTGRSPGRSGAG
jgi:integrase/recombinase XerD